MANYFSPFGQQFRKVTKQVLDVIASSVPPIDD